MPQRKFSCLILLFKICWRLTLNQGKKNQDLMLGKLWMPVGLFRKSVQKAHWQLNFQNLGNELVTQRDYKTMLLWNHSPVSSASLTTNHTLVYYRTQGSEMGNQTATVSLPEHLQQSFRTAYRTFLTSYELVKKTVYEEFYKPPSYLLTLTWLNCLGYFSLLLLSERTQNVRC